MDVNSINTNISSLNNVPNQQVDRSEHSNEVNNNSEFLKLSINEYNKQRDELSSSLQTYNEGIGISITANNGLENEKEYLNNIQDKLNQVKENNQNLDDKNQIKNEINQELLNFREEAFNTTYKKENLLYLDEYEENSNIDISTKEAYFSIDKPNTPQIASQVANQIKNSDLNTEVGLNEGIASVQEGIAQIENIQAQFQNLRTNLETSAKTSIQDQIQLSNQNRITNQFDFPKEVTDFTKSNVSANAGYLAASQANIVQDQSVRLLTSK